MKTGNFSLNRYAYCKDNPVTYTDPDGHHPLVGVLFALWDMHDAYKSGKKKGLKGKKLLIHTVGRTLTGMANPFKKFKRGKNVYKVSKKFKGSKSLSKRIKKYFNKPYKSKKRSKAANKKGKTHSKKPSKRKNKKSKKKKATKPSKKKKASKGKKGNNYCFVAGTLVSAEDGEVPIEDIQEGDLVWSKDPKTGEIALKEVKTVYVSETDEIIKLTVDGEVIETTPAHVFYTEEYGWIPAGYLEEGVTLLLQSGKKVKIDSIVDICAKEPVRVYNFEVENSHTYYVSELGVLVHNMCAKKKTTKKTGKEKASMVPEWSKYYKPKRGENGNEFATRICDERYGRGNYKTGPGTEHNQIRKGKDRGYYDGK